MIRKSSIGFLVGLITLFFSQSCTLVYQTQNVHYKGYQISKDVKEDSLLTALISPYAKVVNQGMSEVLAISEIELVKKSPEGTLGNVLADAMLFMGTKNYKTPVDAAIINSGGIRLNSLPAGDITLGKVFEVLPFDNVLILQKMSGAQLQEFLDHIASRGGWPCAGMSMQIKNRKAVNVKIGGVDLSESSIYTITTLDYIANGGDDCFFLKVIPQVNNGYLFRDAIIDYFKWQTKEGKKITSQIEKRITNAE